MGAAASCQHDIRLQKFLSKIYGFRSTTLFKPVIIQVSRLYQAERG
jgi:hypothetical protein